MKPATTIFAPATAQGRAGVAVLRISGPDARAAFKLLEQGSAPLNPREATLRKIFNPETNALIDHAIVLWFTTPNSFTGEDVLELHLHGGRAVMNAAVEALHTLPGFRLAEAGEFTRRAFENGKLDLTEAEAIADLVDAETDAQRRQALRQMEGALGTLYHGWHARLAPVLAYLEAAIDFADEDLPADVAEQQMKTIRALVEEIGAYLNDGHRGEQLREGFSVAILGPPNAGKSSILNALARREAAIVSATAGTTRDVIEVHLDLGGYPVMLADTAGLRESADAIESEGVRRALHRAEQADLKLLVFDGAQWPKLDVVTSALADETAIIIVNKSDIIGGQDSGVRIQEALPRILIPESRPPLFLSAKTGAGMPQLLDKLTAEITKRFSDTGAPPLTRARHREALEECRDHLQRAQTAREAELRAEDVRLAMRALGRITGRVDVEGLLDIIFRDFCIGK
jgi:tRNA modification GTPase